MITVTIPLQVQTEAARFASTVETTSQLHATIRHNAIASAVGVLGQGDGGRAALDIMLAALHEQAPLSFRPTVTAA